MSDEGGACEIVGPGRPRHSRADIAEAALGLLRERGLAELSMRNIAARLGVQASALYWHFPSKQHLLAAVSDILLAQAPGVGDAGTWRERLREEAGALYGALMQTSDGAELVASTLALGLGGQAIHTRLAEALRGDPPEGPGLDEAGSRIASQAIEHVLLGHAMHWQQRRQAERLGLRAPDPRDEGAIFAGTLEILIAGIAAAA